MVTDLQKASFGKRIIAAIFDGILLSILAVGLAAVLALATGYNGYIEEISNISTKYEKKYNIEFQISEEEYNNLTETEQETWQTANKEFGEDQDAQKCYGMIINLSMLILSISVLLSVIVIEFIVPIMFGNGQTLGKKIFGIGVMHVDGIKISNVQLFARSVLGKFAIELMIPLSIVLMVLLNSIGIVSIGILFVILVIEVISLISTRTNALIHDLLAGTVTVDITSQRIFENSEQLLEYKKKIEAERAARADY